MFILPEEAKVCIYDLLEIRLHMKCPGSDYRRYETIYTDAMVTAM